MHLPSLGGHYALPVRSAHPGFASACAVGPAEVRLRLSELSVASDSGWRSLDETHVSTLEETVRSGGWGQTTLVRPSVVCEAGKKLTSSEDGRYLVNNGLHAIKALMNVAASFDVGEKAAPCDTAGGRNEAPPIWLNEELALIFSEGLLVDLVEYSSPDRSARLAIQAMAHEQEQNRYRPATLKNKVDLVSRIHDSVKDWGLVTKQLLEVLGTAKRCTIQRWITLARDLDEEVLHEIQQKHPALQQEYVVGNKFLVGRGESARFKLTPAYASVALEWLLDAMGAGTAVSATTFANEMCMPAKTLELWERSTLSKYGVTAKTFKPFSRVVSNLQRSGRGRILTCIQQRIPLGGSTTSTAVGIEECKAVLDELAKMRAGSTNESGGKTLAQPQGSDAAAGEDAGVEGDSGDLLVVDDTAAVADPLAKELHAEVEKQLLHVAIHTEARDFMADCRSRIIGSEKAIIYVEAPTSRIRLLTDLMKLAADLPGADSSAVFVPVGSRLSMLAGAEAATKKYFPGRQAYTIAIGGDQQSARARTNFAIYVPVPSVRELPISLSSAGCRARPAEGLRMRCKSSACKHRPRLDGAGTEADDMQEVLPEDVPSGGELADDVFEEEPDDHGGDGLPAVEGAVEEGASGRVLANLFPVAYPVSLHAVVLNALKASSMSHLFLLTRTAHPGLRVAAREVGLEVLVLMMGASDHARAHGEELFAQIVASRSRKKIESAAKTAARAKRVCKADLQFIVVPAPRTEEQAIRVLDVALDDATPAWRRGLNKAPGDLETKMVAALQSELDKAGLYLDKLPDGSIALHTEAAKREGDVVCVVTGLLYNSIAGMANFMSQGGNKVLVDRLLEIRGLAQEDGAETLSLYMAVTGAARYLRHYLGIRRGGPNAILRVSTERGCGDGFVTAVVQTRNGAGIAARSPIVINYGNEYETAVATSTADSDEADAKRFRGVLDSYFKSAMGNRVLKEPTAAAPLAPPQGGKAGGTGPLAEAGVGPGGSEPSVPKAGAVQGGARAGAAAAAANGKRTAEAGGQEGQAAAKKARPEEIELGKVEAPIKASLILRFGELVLRPDASVKGNKKIAPKIVLAKCQDGTVAKPRTGTNVPMWSFKSLASAMVMNQSSQIVKLADFCEAARCKSITRHSIKGNSLVAQGDVLGFNPTADHWTQATTIAHGLSQIGVHFCVKKKADGDEVVPAGVALATAKQVVVTGGQDYIFQ